MLALATVEVTVRVREDGGFADHRDALLLLARRLCGNTHDAQDLVQDTFERALRCSSRFRPGTNALAWLSTILRRLFLDEYRRMRRRQAIVEPMASCAGSIAARTYEEPAWASIGRDDVARALDALEEPFKSAFVLHAIEGRSYSEISAHLGVPKATVGTRLVRARRKLRCILSDRMRSAV